jgi:hypothetical protein
MHLRSIIGLKSRSLCIHCIHYSSTKGFCHSCIIFVGKNKRIPIIMYLSGEKVHFQLRIKMHLRSIIGLKSSSLCINCIHYMSTKGFCHSCIIFVGKNKRIPIIMYLSGEKDEKVHFQFRIKMHHIYTAIC